MDFPYTLPLAFDCQESTVIKVLTKLFIHENTRMARTLFLNVLRDYTNGS